MVSKRVNLQLDDGSVISDMLTYNDTTSEGGGRWLALQGDWYATGDVWAGSDAYTSYDGSFYAENGNVNAKLGVAFTEIGNNFVYPHELHFPVSFLYMYQN